jgi:hypothetical protein
MQGSVLTVAAFDGERIAAVNCAPVPADADREWLDGLVAREALRVGLARPKRVQVCGPVPAAWASHAGRLKFACSLVEVENRDLSALARLAATGSGS